MSESATLQARDNRANPAPLGLFGFGMTTVLLNLHNAGFFHLNSMILAMGLCYGGTAQVIAGILEFRKNNTFGMTAFISYGFFWISLVALLLLPTWFPSMAIDKAEAPAVMASYLGIWGLFTLGLFFGTFRLSMALQIVFGSLVILFFLLAIGDYLNLSDTFKHSTGFEGVLCGLSAIYTGLAQVLNEVYGKTVLPLGTITKK